MKSLFNVKGYPFYPVGGQTHNSSGYDTRAFEKAIIALKAISANSVEVPVYWEQVEPEEGCFQFDHVGEIIKKARENDLHVILLWFATWKNGCMKYAPLWVKQDTQRFLRVTAHDGVQIPVLSSHCVKTREADKNAFCKLLEYVKKIDESENTVIGIQVENEPGILGSDRDYGSEAEKELCGKLPKTLCDALKLQESLTFKDAFAERAGECMTAWSIGSYIDDIAKAGKAIYNIPMIVNVWLGMITGLRPGLNYPSGGAVKPCLQIWKAATPHIDCIAPDNYIRAKNDYDEINNIYSRSDNPLFIPESGIEESNAINMFSAVGDKKAQGYFCFGVESVLDQNNILKPECRGIADSFCCLSMISPLLAGGEYINSTYTVLEQEFSTGQMIDVGKYNAIIDYDSKYCDEPGLQNGRGRGLIVKTGEDEFYVAGVGFTVYFSKKIPPEEMQTPRNARSFLFYRLQNYISVEQGFFKNGEFVKTTVRSGDESDFGIWVKASSGVVRVRICD